LARACAACSEFSACVSPQATSPHQLPQTTHLDERHAAELKAVEGLERDGLASLGLNPAAKVGDRGGARRVAHEPCHHAGSTLHLKAWEASRCKGGRGPAHASLGCCLRVTLDEGERNLVHSHGVREPVDDSVGNGQLSRPGWVSRPKSALFKRCEQSAATSSSACHLGNISETPAVQPAFKHLGRQAHLSCRGHLKRLQARPHQLPTPNSASSPGSHQSTTHLRHPALRLEAVDRTTGPHFGGKKHGMGPKIAGRI
jgi:hypothetical protein